MNFLRFLDSIREWFGSKPVVRLQGFDLSKWVYLGTTEITYFRKTDGVEETTVRGVIFFFVSKKNDAIRDFAVSSSSKYEDFKTHTFVINCMLPWKANQHKFWNFIDAPSESLRNRMAEEYQVVFDFRSKTWKQKTTTQSNDGNIITVDFTKK